MSVELPTPIKKIQDRVVGMYSTNPWPLNRDAEEEMGWRLKCLGIVPGDWRDKHVLDMGCGTGEYALWYATNGARKVTAIDLSDGSLTIADEIVRRFPRPGMLSSWLIQNMWTIFGSRFYMFTLSATKPAK